MCYNERGRLYNLPLRRQCQRKRSLKRFGRLDRGIMNATDHVGVAERKRSLNRSPGLTVLQPTRSSRAEFYKTEISENI